MAIHGSTTYLNLANSSNTPTDVSAKTREVNFTLDEQVHDTTTFGQTAHTKTVGLKDGKFTATFVSDNTIMDQLTGLYTTQSPGASSPWAFIIGPRGSTTGFEKFSGNCWLTSLPLSTKVDDIETIQAQFECSGSITIGVF